MTDEIIEVGPNKQVPFFVMTEAGFPWGLRCATCSRQITEGQPYESRATGVNDDGSTNGVITCVYCPDDHECDAGYFDRTLCGCGAMHSYCDTCGERDDPCPLDDDPPRFSPEKDVIAQAIAAHQDSYESDDLPTPFHGYAQAVVTALHAAGYRIIPPAPVLTDLPEPKGNHCRGCGWSSGGHDPRCPSIPPASTSTEETDRG